MDQTDNRPKCIVTVFLIILWGIVIYANAVNGRFQFDDYPVIAQNPVIRSATISGLLAAVPHPTRVIPYLTFALNYRLNGLDPAGYHVINIMVHVINALLVFQLVRLLYRTPSVRGAGSRDGGFSVAGLCAMLFLSHPVQTESVTYITQRFTCLAVLFYLASVCFYLQGRLTVSAPGHRPWIFFFLCGLSTAGGMLTKQITLTIPLVIMLTEVMFFEAPPKRMRLWLMAPAALFLLLIPALYAFDAPGIFSITHDSGSHRGDVITASSYALTQPRVIMTYLRLLLFPAVQNLLYDFRISQRLLEGKTLLSVVSILLLIIAGFKMYRTSRLIAFGIFWFFITLSVESSVIPIRHVIFEHRLYLPSVGFFLAAALVLERLFERKRSFIAVGLAVIVILSVLTVRRNMVWKDGITMWQDVVAKSPGQSRPYYNLGYEYMKSGQPQAALIYLSKAIALQPDYFDAYNNRSQVYFDLGKLDLAMDDINRALSIDDHRAEAYLNRGMIIRQTGRYDAALKDFSRAVELDPDNAIYYTNRGMTYGNTGRFDLALADLDRALALNPGYARAYNIRGAVLLSLSRRKEALADFGAAVRCAPGEPEAYRNRAHLYQEDGQYDLARRDLDKVIKLNPDNLEAYLDRAFILNKSGKLDEALSDYDEILKRDPSMAQIYMEKGKIYYRQRRYGRAADEFERALKKSPGNASGYFLKGLCHYELKQYQQALTDVNKARELGQPVDEEYLIRIKQALGQT